MRNIKFPKANSPNDPPSADEEVAKLRLRLRHLSLVHLDEEQIVNWDRDNHIVTKGPRFDETWSELRND